MTEKELTQILYALAVVFGIVYGKKLFRKLVQHIIL